MKSTATKATAFAITAFAAALANAQPRLEQTGDGYSVAHGDAAARGNVTGGGEARFLGGGEDGTILYAGPDPAQEGRWAALSGGGADAAVTYAEPAAAAGAMAASGGTGAAGPGG